MYSGDVMELDEDGAAVTGKVHTGAIMVDGLGVGDVGNIVLRDRQHLSEDGIMVVVLTLEKRTNQLLAGPDIVSRGFVYVRESEDLLEEAHAVVVDAVDDCLNQYALPERAELLALYPADYFMDAALNAVSLESSSASVSYTVEDLRPTEDGYELMIRQSAPEEQAGGGAAWLLLVESDNSITPEDAITVILEET